MHGSFAAKPMALSSTRLSGATMGSFATYCGCVADTGVQTDDALSGACWGSAGTIGSAGTFGGCAGSVGTAACYGSAGGKDLMVNQSPISAVNMDSLSQLRMQPLGGSASYGSYACA